jgi:hypothetical protein
MRAAAVVAQAYRTSLGEAQGTTDPRTARVEAIRLVRERGLPVRAVDDAGSPGWGQRADDLSAFAAAGGSVDVVLRGGLDAADDPGYAALVRAGAAARLTARPGVRLVLAGEEAAWVGIGSADERRVVRVVTPVVITALGALHDHLRTTGVVPSDPVLVALAFGVGDERAAAAMGVSHRTYTRRVRALMDQAGVGTRFELACWARDQGRL